MIRKYILVKGIVQGVGFRPFVYKIAIDNKLKGWVKNSCGGVYIDIEGQPQDVSRFIIDLKDKSPVLSEIEDIKIVEKNLKGYGKFEILISDIGKKSKILIDNISGKSKIEYENKKEYYYDVQEEVITLISPDIATCEDCKNEVLDKNNSGRGSYPFANCTNCGPRFTIIKKLPYDRGQTTMNKFEMCSECKSEYENPLNRRFHAEPTCCNKCGPKLSLLDNMGRHIICKDELEIVREYLKDGKIIAVKGLGGFNLICNGKDENVINILRKRKDRRSKPLALMVKDIDVALKYCNINSMEKEILSGNKKPIVLLEKSSSELPRNIAFESSKLGVILPYTPLQYLLFNNDLEVLVFTSANVSGVPMIYENKEALIKLKNIADYFLINNRDINMPVDDSVVNVVLNEERVIRGGRGYSPIARKYQVNRNILALGSQFKNTLSVSNNEYIFTSPYIGDMDNLETYNNFENNMNYIKNIYDINIKTICYDMHPNYWSNNFIKEYNGETLGVYHHHAHIVSCMLDNKITNNGLTSEAIIGLAFDGAGYGDDGEIWGSEFLICNFETFKRVGHLGYMDMPTGDGAVTNPWKMGAGLIYNGLNEYFNSSLDKEILSIIKFLPSQFSYKNINLIRSIIDKKINTHLTSSMGRLFDGVASLLGFDGKVSYEGEAAVYLENLAKGFIRENKDYNYGEFYSYYLYKEYEDNIYGNNEINIVDTNKIVVNILEDLKRKVNKGEIAMKFHNTIIEVSSNICIKLREIYKINKVALSGGVFQNEILLEKLYIKLSKNDFKVLTHKSIPCNDSGISIGQLVIASKKNKSKVHLNK